jgi:hypothetical protein
MLPREPLNNNKHAKEAFWNDLKVQPWPEAISKATPSLWPSREKVEGFHATCTSCQCARTCNTVVFIVGCGHSGTTYMTRLIGSHPEYHAILQETGWFSVMDGTAAAFERFRQDAAGCGRAGKRVLVEKTAKHILHLQQIETLFPGTAKVIMMVRDGRDVVYSTSKRYDRLGDQFSPCSESMRWTFDNKAAIPFVPNRNFLHQVRYEDLINNPSNTMHKVFDFLEGAAAPAEVLAQFETKADLKWGNVKAQGGDEPPGLTHGGVVNKHFRNWQINQPLFDGRGQWATAEQHPFTTLQLQALYDCPRFLDTMLQFGYLDPTNKTQWFDRTRMVGELPMPEQ